MTTYKVGIDIGSTTVKAVLLNDRQEIIFSQYRRHHAHTQETLREILTDARKELGSFRVQAAITGSGGMGLGKALEIPFVQEVVAVAQALRHQAPQTDAAIELGGEDAKIIYFTGGLEERMNGVCAGARAALLIKWPL